MEIAGWVGIGLLAILCIFQIALACGVPWGAASWGGRYSGVLPSRLRVASGIAGLVFYPMIVLSIATSAGLATVDWWPIQGERAMWILTGFFLLGGVLNGISPSKVERLWVLVSLGLAFCTSYIALAL